MKIFVVDKTTIYEYDYPDINVGYFQTRENAEKAIEEDKPKWSVGYYDYYIKEVEV